MHHQEQTPPLPSLLDLLKAGLDLTTKHIWLIILPVLLDVFFWLGPRLSLRPLMESFFNLVVEQAALTGQTQTNIDAFTQAGEQLATSLNLFTTITLPLIGVPALMDGLSPLQTPLQPTVVELNHPLLVFFLMGVFMAGGFVLSLVYYSLVAKITQPEPISWLVWLRQWPRMAAKVTGVLALIAAAAAIITIPFLCLSFFTSLISPNLTLLLWFIGAMPIIMLILYTFFAPHGILLQDRPIIPSLRESLRLVQLNSAAMMGLVVTLYLLNSGLSLLWQIADDGSWLTGVSIIGHAFISTAAAAATFLFYQTRFTTLPPEKTAPTK